MNLLFRPANEQDIPLISFLAEKIWREHYPSIISIEQIEYMLANRYSLDAILNGMKSGEKYFLAYTLNVVHAYASVELDSSSIFLSKFYVDVPKHRKGIGQKFFHYIVSRLDSSLPIRLQVNRQNIKAINFYFKMGFIIEKAADFEIGSGFFMNDFVMVRKGT
ncbi:MAG: GNAT family N-acetyltransferase [Bacteroidetes bacterium]|nr:GNAT family N-acetyltransferase [Bacteroidota bacterium]